VGEEARGRVGVTWLHERKCLLTEYGAELALPAPRPSRTATARPSPVEEMSNDGPQLDDREELSFPGVGINSSR
jgi:hypothetical protein